MKNLFVGIFKKESGLSELKAVFQPLYINPPNFLNAVDDSEHEFEKTSISNETQQDEMQIDNIYLSW
ncbi:MAG: hypothetical protein PSV17_06545 [Methylotenera sp.]|uniref:hypothetical protein n=1 Tax=Methylotenera sp. TaxID=2051956 RepID=UPI002488E5ED|nr:hypothetical protein [Methylotenera sp.]MDI1309079.1 hypothetical protein [Methylotenera sp.]